MTRGETLKGSALKNPAKGNDSPWNPRQGAHCAPGNWIFGWRRRRVAAATRLPRWSGRNPAPIDSRGRVSAFRFCCKVRSPPKSGPIGLRPGFLSSVSIVLSWLNRTEALSHRPKYAIPAPSIRHEKFSPFQIRRGPARGSWRGFGGRRRGLRGWSRRRGRG